MNNNNGFGSPIRTYKKQPQQNPLRTAAVLIMTAVLIAFVVIFIMSLSGTGMFADKKDDGKPDTDPPVSSTPEDSGKEDPDNTTDGTTEDPTAIKFTFVNKSASDLSYGFLQLINKDNLYGFKEESLLETLYGNKSSESYQISSSELKLKYNVIEALNDMMDDFYAETEYKYINVNAAYRTFDEQAALHEKNPTGAVPAGASDYHSGATLGLSGYNPDTQKSVNISNASETEWLKNNAHKYGFIFRSPSDKKDIVGYSLSWQLRYVGVPHAEYMYKNDLCLEEYLEVVAKDHKYGGSHLTLACSDGNTYEVYYVSAPDEGSIKLPVPESRPYTISGDNVGGFIVTMTVEEGTASEA